MVQFSARIAAGYECRESGEGHGEGKLGERDEDVNIPRVQQRGRARNLGAIRRQYENRDDAIRAAYDNGAYSYQKIAKEFGVHFTTVGRVVRQPMRRASATRGKM